jgi:hypothetical protein
MPGAGAEPGAPWAPGVEAAPTELSTAAPHCLHLREPSMSSAPQLGHFGFSISMVGGLKHMD